MTLGMLAMPLLLLTAAAGDSERFTPPLDDAAAWSRLPKALVGGDQPLPVWARMMASDIPRSTAALLQLDHAQRTSSPVNPKLRAAMRWVAAQANGCGYAQAYAEADAIRAGVDRPRLEALAQPGYPGWTDPERAALEFARKMTLDSDSVTDAEFAALVRGFGERQAASMVLILAYANFQDRLLLCLGATVEPGGPLPPLEVGFEPASLTSRTTPPPRQAAPLPRPTGSDLVPDSPDWKAATYDRLQGRLEAQRRKPTRLRVPAWKEVARNLPDGFMKRPSDIIWYRIVFGYAPELAVPYEFFMRTAGAEAAPKFDRIFGGSLFRITTKAIECPYCMGHCEMNWEVAGLTRGELVERSRLLASDNWSSFPPEEQRACAYARKLTKTPWELTPEDYGVLVKDLGPDRAMATFWWLCRGLYMTRVSDGFQLPLERENVFRSFFPTPPNPEAAAAPR